MKKILVIAALLAVMLPVAAAERNGKWFVDVTWSYDMPSGTDTTYAYGFDINNLNNAMRTEAFSIKAKRAGTPQLRFGWEDNTWTAWVSYYRFNKAGQSITGVPAGYDTLFNTLASPGTMWNYPYDGGFVQSDLAVARQKIRNTRWDANIGRKFHPSEKWQLMFYTGIQYFKLDVMNQVEYTDNLNVNSPDPYGVGAWGPGSKDYVTDLSNTHGWGLNLGLVSSSDIGKYVTVSGGLEISMVRSKRTAVHEEALFSSWYSPSYGLYGLVPPTRVGTTKVIPVATMFVDCTVKFNANWYGKIGYKFQNIQNGFTFTKYVNDYPAGGFGYVEQNKDVAFDGLYFTFGVKF